MSKVTVNDSNLTAIADAIRIMTESEEQMYVSEMAGKILEIETGVDTSDADAIASDITEGKTAYVNGTKVVGTSTLADEKAQLEAQVQTLTNQKTQLEGQLESARQELAEITEADDATAEMQTIIDNLQDEVTQLKADKQALQTQLDNVESVIDNVNNEISLSDKIFNNLISGQKECLSESSDSNRLWKISFRNPTNISVNLSPENKLSENLVYFSKNNWRSEGILYLDNIGTKDTFIYGPLSISGNSNKKCCYNNFINKWYIEEYNNGKYKIYWYDNENLDVPEDGLFRTNYEDEETGQLNMVNDPQYVLSNFQEINEYFNENNSRISFGYYSCEAFLRVSTLDFDEYVEQKAISDENFKNWIQIWIDLCGLEN